MIKSPTSCATSCCKQLFVSKLCLLSSSILLKKLPSTWANHSAESPDQYGGSLTLNTITSWPGTAWYPSGVVGVRGIRLSWQWFLSHCVPQREIFPSLIPIVRCTTNSHLVQIISRVGVQRSGWRMSFDLCVPHALLMFDACRIVEFGTNWLGTYCCCYQTTCIFIFKHPRL